MLYMVIEKFREGAARAVYERARQRGRMLPPGVEYLASWVEPNLDRCYQVMRAQSLDQLQEWAANWDDLAAFEFIPVVESSEAARIALSET